MEIRSNCRVVVVDAGTMGLGTAQVVGAAAHTVVALDTGSGAPGRGRGRSTVDVAGFIVNRVARPYHAEALLSLEEGALAWVPRAGADQHQRGRRRQHLRALAAIRAQGGVNQTSVNEVAGAAVNAAATTVRDIRTARRFY